MSSSISESAKELLAKIGSERTPQLVKKWLSGDSSVLDQLVIQLKWLENLPSDLEKKKIKGNYDAEIDLSMAARAITEAGTFWDGMRKFVPFPDQALNSRWAVTTETELRNIVRNIESAVTTLENVKGTFDLVEKDNPRLRHLIKRSDELEFDWGWGEKSGISDDRVLDTIRANKHMKRLTIQRYRGKMLSNWIVRGAPSFTNLASLEISRCDNCEALPSLGNLPCLGDLRIDYLPRLKSLDEDFYGNGHSPFNALQKLYIAYCSSLEMWSFPDRKGFSSLTELEVSGCDRLKNLPYCFPSLTVLRISRCSELAEIDARRAGEESDERQYGQRLRSLYISSCRQLQSIPKSSVNLAKLMINDECTRLVSEIYSSGITKYLHTSLRDLEIPIPSGDNAAIMLPPNLSYLTIYGNNIEKDAPTSFPPLGNHTSLTSLVFRNHRFLKSFPDTELPSSLMYLTIDGWSALQTISEKVISRCRQLRVQLWIKKCPSLECLTTSLSTLEGLYLYDCPIVQLRPNSDTDYLSDLTKRKAAMVDNFVSERASSPYTLEAEDGTSLLTVLMKQLYIVAALSDNAEKKIERSFGAAMWKEEVRCSIDDAVMFFEKMYMDLPQSNKASYTMVDSGESSQSVGKIHSFKWKEIAHTLHSYKEDRESELLEIIQRLKYVATWGHDMTPYQYRPSNHNLGLEEYHELKLCEGLSAKLADHLIPLDGQSKDKKEIVRLLKSINGNEDTLQSMHIFGESGVGKTTVASMVYNDCTYDDGSEVFEVKGWACLSDVHQESHVIRSLLQSLNRRESAFNNDLDLLKRELKERLQGKRYLLVLDGISIHTWESLQKHFLVGVPGSRIIVTTRSQNAGKFVIPFDLSYEVKGLSKNDSWSLFKRIALLDGDSDEYQMLKNMAKEICGMCEGMPLELKMIGGLLLSKGVDTNDWRNALNRMTSSSMRPVFASLWLCYYNLPQLVKRCFSYLSLFPKGYQFTMEEIEMLWVDEDFEVLEDSHKSGYKALAETVFSILCSRFLIQPGNFGFVINDIVHDLALYTSGDLVVDLHNVNEGSCWLSYHRNEDEDMLDTKSVRDLCNLQIFFSFGSFGATSGLYFNPKVLNDILSEFTLLRVLSLQGYAISELPKSVVNMKHLRCLNLAESNIHCLPEELHLLVNLRILNLLNCRKLKRLPANICDLIKLRRLNIEGTQITEMPDRIGRLTRLRMMPRFVLGKGKSKQMREFEKLDDLHGKLHISRLDNVGNKDDVEAADFGKKEYLDELVLEWDSNKYRSTKLDSKVLDGIKPHANLKRLTIKWYGGDKLSVGIQNLVSLAISNCFKCVALPSLGGLACLKDLSIEGLDCLQVLNSEFYGYSEHPFRALEKLKISHMEALTEWSPPQVNMRGFESLKELQIESCEELTKIPYCFPRLIRLDISKCYSLVELQMNGDECGKSLRYLDVKGCSELENLPKSFVNLSEVNVEVCYKLDPLLELKSVRKLSLQYVGDSSGVESAIKKCGAQVLNKLAIWLPRNVAAELLGSENALLKRLTSLKHLHLEIENDARMDDDVSLPPNTSNIFVRGGNCCIQRKIISELHNLKYLTHLEFFECHALHEFPDVALPSTITSLRISLCDGLKSIQEPFLEGCSKSLEDLEICCCEKLECLPLSLYTLESLQMLTLTGCPLIDKFPTSFDTGLHHLAKLSYLWISDCSNFLLLQFPKISSIYNLGIIRCPKLVLPGSGFPTNLKHLTIIDCDELKSISNMMLMELKSLSSLHLEGFWETRTLDDCLPDSIEDLTIRHFPLLESVSKVQSTFRNLRCFEMEHCPLVNK